MQIDLKPDEFRRGPLRRHPLDHKVFMRAAAACGLWFAAVVLFGRIFDHGLPWFLIALPAAAPTAILLYIAIALDD